METETLIILWEGVNEFELFEGTLEGAIASVKDEQSYCNYGRMGATIVRAGKLYEISMEAVEKTYI